MKNLLLFGLFGITILLAGCGESKIDKLITQNNYNKEFIDQCITESTDMINDIMKVLDGTLVVNNISDYQETENELTATLEIKYDVNPIRAIHYTDTYVCTKTGNNIPTITIKSVNMEASPCPDGTIQPAGVRCPGE